MEKADRESIMKQWDRWRKYIANGGTGSWPRDAFEALLDYLDERLEDKVRERFKHIIDGKGLIIPRIAVKIAIDDIFGKPDVPYQDGLFRCPQCNDRILKPGHCHNPYCTLRKNKRAGSGGE